MFTLTSFKLLFFGFSFFFYIFVINYCVCLMFIPCISDVLEEKTNNMH
jgi:hypothetical protein